MDFSTTKEKIENKVYSNVMEYKADVKLICVNAMNYNHPETIYYKVIRLCNHHTGKGTCTFSLDIVTYEFGCK